MFRNSDVTTQAIDVQNGNADIVMDLSSDQLAPLRGAEGLTIDETASPTIFFLFANANPEISEVTSNPDFVEAVRYGLDYAGILELAGEGAVQAPGVIPTHFLGTLSARPSRPARPPPGARGPRPLRLRGRHGAAGVRRATSPPNGLAFQPIAERIVANLEEVGISVELVPGPIATTLENYRAGNEQMGLWLWGPDYPDPQDYLVFGPGALVGVRAGWAEGAAPEIEAVAQEAATTVDDAVREPLYRAVPADAQRVGPVLPADPADRRGRFRHRPGHRRQLQPGDPARRCGCSHPPDTDALAMGRFLTRRLLAAVLLLLGITLVTFVLTNVVPGDPAAANLGPAGDRGPRGGGRLQPPLRPGQAAAGAVLHVPRQPRPG